MAKLQPPPYSVIGLCITAYLPPKNKFKTHGPAAYGLLLLQGSVCDLTSTLGSPVYEGPLKRTVFWDVAGANPSCQDAVPQ